MPADIYGRGLEMLVRGGLVMVLLIQFCLVCTTETNEIITKYEIVSVCGGDGYGNRRGDVSPTYGKVL